MEIVFEVPWFSSQEDENRFFELLYDLPQYSKVVGKGTRLYLELKSPVEESTVLSLLQIFHHWKIGINSLIKLKPLLPESALWNL